MEHEPRDFGTGLLAYVSRNPRWVPDRRELVRVAWTPAPEEAVSRRTTSLALVPFVAAILAELAS
jgi:hypothetical protein